MNKYYGCNEFQVKYLSEAIKFDELNDIENAKINYLKVINIEDSVPYANSMLGGIEYDKGNFQEAIKYFDKAIELYPNCVQSIELRAEAKERLGFLDSALNDYYKVIEITSDYAQVYFNIGLIYEFKKEYYRALRFYRLAKRINPSNFIFINKYEKFTRYIKYLKKNFPHKLWFVGIGVKIELKPVVFRWKVAG